jgi:uracil phosphoribosyltransferase
MDAQTRIVEHPLIQHKLTHMRKKETGAAEFRRLLREIAMLLAYEVMREQRLQTMTISTPVTTMEAPVLAAKNVCFVSILRAGNGLLDGMLEIMPDARVGHIGIYRDPATLAAVEYYCKLPVDIAEREVFVLDPMLATGHSAVAAIARVKAAGAAAVRYVCLLAAPEGLEAVYTDHPDVTVYTAAIDSHLNDHGYIVPGLGDAGDRLFGTR